MRVKIKKDIPRKRDYESLQEPWVRAGEYSFVRMFDQTRLLIDLGRLYSRNRIGERQLTLVNIGEVEFAYETADASEPDFDSVTAIE